jgi:hypothetical protein
MDLSLKQFIGLCTVAGGSGLFLKVLAGPKFEIGKVPFGRVSFAVLSILALAFALAEPPVMYGQTANLLWAWVATPIIMLGIAEAGFDLIHALWPSFPKHSVARAGSLLLIAYGIQMIRIL